MRKQTRKDKTNKPEVAAEIQATDPAESAAESEEPQDVEVELDEISLELTLEKLKDAEAAALQAKEDLLRVQAEMQNLRRRTEQDIEKAHKYGQERLTRELLVVMDNLERSLVVASNPEDKVAEAIYEGVDLTLKSLTDCFSKFQIEVVDPMGEPFDPQLHQAMSMQDNPEVEPNTILAVMQKGYTLHGRVIRPAMVTVAKGSSPGIDEEA